MKNLLKFASVLLIFMLFFGCAGSSRYMKDVTDGEVSYVPGADQSVILFMRPSTFGFAIQSAVFDVTTDENKLVGIVSAKKKVVYITEPGKHLLMVTGEAADFMQADLEPGKTYYVLVNPVMGVWKARFSLGAIHKNVNHEKLEKWKNACQYNEVIEATHQWAEKNSRSIQAKRTKYLPRWEAKPESKKPTLFPDDGF